MTGKISVKVKRRGLVLAKDATIEQRITEDYVLRFNDFGKPDKVNLTRGDMLEIIPNDGGEPFTVLAIKDFYGMNEATAWECVDL